MMILELITCQRLLVYMGSRNGDGVHSPVYRALGKPINSQ